MHFYIYYAGQISVHSFTSFFGRRKWGKVVLPVLISVNLDDLPPQGAVLLGRHHHVKLVLYSFTEHQVYCLDVVFNQSFIGRHLHYFYLKPVPLLNVLAHMSLHTCPYTHVLAHICTLQDGFLEALTTQLKSMFMEQIKEMLCICYFFLYVNRLEECDFQS